MKKLGKLLNTAALACLIASCGKNVTSKKDVKVQEPKPTQTAPVQEERDVVSKAILLELDAPGGYEVQLNWERVQGAHSYLIKRVTLPEKELKQIDVVEADLSSYIDDSVQMEAAYKYEVLALLEDTSELVHASQLSIPRDLQILPTMKPELVSAMIFSSEKALGRIFTKGKMTLHTYGKKVSAQVSEIVADELNIVHEYAAKAAPKGQHGKVLPPFNMKVGKLSGRVFLRVLAQQGGQGIDQARRPATNPNRGKKGRDAAISLIECLRNAENGGRGPVGSKGFPGTRGFNGAMTPLVMFSVADNSELLFDYEIQTSKAGVGGLGGLGGLGGRGGSPGSRRGYCQRKAKEGPRGPTGPRGVSGPVGKPGLSNSFCIQMNGNSLQGDCEKVSSLLEQENK